MNRHSNNLSQQSINTEQSLAVMVTELTHANTGVSDSVDAIKQRQHKDIVSLAIRLNNGAFIQTIDEDMLFRFNKAQNALAAAAEIQKEIDRLNMANKFNNPLLMRIGLHSSNHLEMDHGIPTDLIDLARQIKSLTVPGEIIASQSFCNDISNMHGMVLRPINQRLISASQPSDNIFKVIWNPQEVELATPHTIDSQTPQQIVSLSKLKLILLVIMPMLFVLFLTLHEKIISQLRVDNETRTMHQSIEQ